MLPPKGKYRVPEDCNWNTAPGMEVPMIMIMAARLLSEIVGKEKVVGDHVTGAMVRKAVSDFQSCDSFVRVLHGGHPHPGFEKYYLNPDFDPDVEPEPIPEADYQLAQSEGGVHSSNPPLVVPDET